MNESEDVEKPCVDMAKLAGWHNRKLDVGPGGKGWLDQLFLGPNGEHFIVEFKTLDGTISAKQHKKIRDLRALDHDVYVVDDTEHFEAILMHHDNMSRMSIRKGNCS